MQDIFYSNQFRHWWIPLITGLLSIFCGVWCFIFPSSSMESLAIFFECVLLVAGIFNICYALGNISRNSHWGWPLANGIIETLLAIWLWTMPLETLTVVFVYAVGFWLLFMMVYGITEITALYSMRMGWVGWLLGLLIIGIVCVIIALMGPVGGGIFVWLFIGASFLTYGITRIMLSIRMKRYNDRH